MDGANVKRIGTNLLVLGGTSFVGRNFCEHIRDFSALIPTLLNRGVTNSDLFPRFPRIRCDRNNRDECKHQLLGTHWDCIVDFNGNEDAHIRNVLDYCTCDHYTFVSSSAVDRTWPTDTLFSMAQNKLWCEHLLQKYVTNLLVIRPGFVCGNYDYTSRFELSEGRWVWRGTQDLVYPMIHASVLSSMMMRMIVELRIGVVRCGYTTLGEFNS